MWKLIVPLVVIILGIYLYSGGKTREGIVIQTGSGKVKGIIDESRDGREFYSWRGIPYAQPPIGELRFATPKRVKKWNGILDASDYSARCAQVMFPLGYITGDEDCLYLNVYVPKKLLDEKKKLPVVAHIHGGAFVVGSGADVEPHFWMDQDVIFITLNYRVGILGFFSLGDKNIRGNMGLKDQALALKWIKDNVEHFGGDPSRITIWGISAGAVSVHYQMLSDKTKGLFQRAISTSGTSLMTWGFAPTQKAIAKTKELSERLDCPTGNHEKLTSCLRSLDMKTLLGSYQEESTRFSLSSPSRDGDLIVPTVELVDDDESFLTSHPSDILSAGQAHRIPYLTGICPDEGLLGTGEFYRDPSALERFESDWAKSMDENFAFSRLSNAKEGGEKLKEFYLNGRSPMDVERLERIKKYTEMVGDGTFIIGTSEVGRIQREFSPVYLYLYNRTGGPTMGYFFAEWKARIHPIIDIFFVIGNYLVTKYVWREPLPDYGISHADDMFMQMSLPIYGVHKDHPDAPFSRDYVKLYYDFATGDLNSLEFRGVKVEPTPKKGELKYLFVHEKPKMIDEPFAQRSKLWRSINYAELFSSKTSKKT